MSVTHCQGLCTVSEPRKQSGHSHCEMSQKGYLFPVPPSPRLKVEDPESCIPGQSAEPVEASEYLWFTGAPLDFKAQPLGTLQPEWPLGTFQRKKDQGIWYFCDDAALQKPTVWARVSLSSTSKRKTPCSGDFSLAVIKQDARSNVQMSYSLQCHR